MTSSINYSEHNSNSNFLAYNLLKGSVQRQISGGVVALSEISFIVKNPDRDKNIHLIIFFILPTSSIAAIVMRPPAACRRFSPDQGDRRLAAKPVIVLIILINALCARFTSRFPNPAASMNQSELFDSVFDRACFITCFSWSGATRLKDIVLIG